MAKPMVRAEGVHKRFGRLEVLRGITLEVGRGEVMCIIGPSGSGKSTFLRTINHLEKINRGRLWVDGSLVGYVQRGDKLHELRDNALIQYRVRKLNFISGYARLEQGFSNTGSRPEVISSYYMGISRWFNFF